LKQILKTLTLRLNFTGSRFFLLLIIIVGLNSCERSSEYEFILKNNSTNILKVDMVAISGYYTILNQLVFPNEEINLILKHGEFQNQAVDCYIDTITEFKKLTIKKTDIILDTSSNEIDIRLRKYWDFHTEDGDWIGIYKIEITDEFLDTISN